MKTRIATGFEFQPLSDGNVLIEFYGDDGETFNTQIVTGEVVANMPLVAHLTGLALTDGIDAVEEAVSGTGWQEEVQDAP